MIGITPDKVQRDIAAICALSQFNDHIRSHVLEETDLSAAATQAGAAKYIEARAFVAEPIQWKIFSHCASVTRLYAIYESFVYDLLSSWLNILPSIYDSYSRLPETIAKNHRVGVGSLLQKFGGGTRTEALTELSIVQPLFSGLSGQKDFALIPDAFFIDSKNLRYEELCGLFAKVSLSDLGSWLTRHKELHALCDAAGTTISGRLKELVDFRNEASHARQDIDETLGVSTFREMADFVQVLCVALYQFVNVRHVDSLQELGRLELLGRITEYLPRIQAAILTTQAKVRVTVGDEVIVRGGLKCFVEKIIDMQDSGQHIETIEANSGYELGLKFNQANGTKGAFIFRLRPRDNASTTIIDDQAAYDTALPPISKVSSRTAEVVFTADEYVDITPLKPNRMFARVRNAFEKLRKWFQRLQ